MFGVAIGGRREVVDGVLYLNGRRGFVDVALVDNHCPPCRRVGRDDHAKEALHLLEELGDCPVWQNVGEVDVAAGVCYKNIR